MTGLKPFFCYFGGKWRAAPHYPAPKHEVLIEPFAGAAGYATRYPDRKVILIERSPTVAALWRYLIGVSPEEVRRLPLMMDDQSVDDLDVSTEARSLIGYWLNKGTSMPCKSPSAWMRRGDRPNSFWGEVIRERIAMQVDRIRHWTIIEGSYEDAPDVIADWFIDPPYVVAGRNYKYNDVNYASLANWSLARQGQVIVCEAEGADWLPFNFFREIKASEASRGGKISREVIYHAETEDIIMTTYPTLSVEDFGRQLILTGDLDPVYIALNRVEWDDQHKSRWLLAYWLFYHPGAACYMSDAEGEGFWSRVRSAAVNISAPPVGERWPRASERRHFRGDKCVKAVEELQRRFAHPEMLISVLNEAAGVGYQHLFNFVCSLPQFGPWMAFKVADMLERCMAVEIDFDLNSVTMFDDPKKAALMVAREKLKLAEGVKFKDSAATIRQVVEHLIAEFRNFTAPPAHDRPIGYQEVETVLCKWKSHVNGHYPVGKDCREIREGLLSWAEVSDSAAEFLHWMPVGETTSEAIPA